MTETTVQRVDPIRPLARRGETVALVTRNRHSYQAGPDVVATELTLGVATNLTRDGRVKAVRRFGWGETPIPVDRIVGLVQALPALPFGLIGKRREVEASEELARLAEKVARERAWPSGNGKGYRPWRSLSELRADLAPELARWNLAPLYLDGQEFVQPGWWWAQRSLGERGGRAGER